MASQNDILAIFARHMNWHGDEGDRRTVAEFLDRDPDESDPFGPLDSDESDDNDENSDNKGTDPSPLDLGTAKTPAKSARSTGAPVKSGSNA